MACSQQGVGRRGDLAIGIDEVGRSGVQVGTDRIGRENLASKRLKTASSGLSGQRLLLGLERQVKVLEPLRGPGRKDLLGQLLGQLPLRLDRAKDRLLAVGQQAHFRQPGLDLPDLLFVEPFGLIFAIPRDEGDRIAVVEQFNGRLDLAYRNAKASGHMP